MPCHRSISPSAARRASLLSFFVLAASACSSSGSGSAAPGAVASANSSVTSVAPASTCRSPAITDPPACKLARTWSVGATFGPDHATVIVSVGREVPGANDTESDEVWNAREGRHVATLEKGIDRVGELAAAWSADRTRVAVIGAGDSKLGYGIFDTATYKPIVRNTGSVWAFPCAIAVDPAGKRVAVTTLIGQAWVDDFQTGKSLGSIPVNGMRAAGHQCSDLEWSGDGEIIAVEGVRTPKGLREIPKPPGLPEGYLFARPAPAGDLLAYLDGKGDLYVYSKHGKKKLQVIHAGSDLPKEEGVSPVRGLSWKPDGEVIVTWDIKGRLRAWDPKTGAMAKDMRGGAKPMEGYPYPDTELTRLVWSPDGRVFAFNGDAGPEMWSLEEGAQKLKTDGAPTPKEPDARLSPFLFSPDSSLLLGGMGVWNTKTGAFVREVPPASQWIDSGFLVLASDYDHQGPARILRVSDGAVLNIDRLGDDATPVLLARTDAGVYQGPPELAGCALPAPEPHEAPPASTGAPALPGGTGGPTLLPTPGGTATSAGTTTVKARPIAPEPRDTLIADFWSGKSVARTCPSP